MSQKHYYLYFAGFDGLTEQVGVARSTDQIHWEVTPQPAIPIGKAGEWDCIQTSNPCVIRENGRFRMWYQGVDDRHLYRIGYAESEDGWTWTKIPEVMFERPNLDQITTVPRREGYHQPLVLKEENRYLMYFLDHRDGLGYVRGAESPDGFNWTVFPEDCIQPQRSWEDRGLHYPWVIRDGAGYTMWYTSQSSKHGFWYLTRAVSADGVKWRREPDQPVMSITDARKISRFHWLLPRKLLRLFPDYLHPNFRNRARAVKLPQGFLGKWLVNWHDSVIYPLRQNRYIALDNGSVEKLADGSYLMYYQALTECSDATIGTAVSTDGIAWTPQRVGLLRPAIQQHQIDWCAVFDADPHLLIWED